MTKIIIPFFSKFTAADAADAAIFIIFEFPPGDLNTQLV